MPHIRTAVEKITKSMTGMSYSYEDDYIPGSSSESVVVSNSTLSARGMYWYTFSSRRVIFTRCDFSPAAAAILSSSIGYGSTVHGLASGGAWVEFVRYVVCILYRIKVCFSLLYVLVHISALMLDLWS